MAGKLVVECRACRTSGEIAAVAGSLHHHLDALSAHLGRASLFVTTINHARDERHARGRLCWLRPIAASH
jgi:hypothetical protein